MARAAWCYGSPGIARALWLAGRALRRQEFQDLVLEAMAAVFRRPFATLKLDSTMFCHGQADVLQVTWRFARETRQKEFLEAAASLTESILARHDEASVTKPSSASSVTTRWALQESL
jgi:lantibiotic modifying enzyme